MKPSLLAIAMLALLARPVAARDLCPDRPGLDTPPCTVEPGKLMVETSIGDWTHDADAGDVTDTLLIGDLSLRYGVAEHAEVRVGWTAFGHERMRDTMTGMVDRLSGTGDVTLGMKRNLFDPDGQRFSIALLPEVSLPIGGRAIGAGDWGAAMLAPMSLPLVGPISLVLTPEVDAAVDEDRHGRHLAYGSAGGVMVQASDRLNFSAEASVFRDRDPGGHQTLALFAATAALKLGDNTQIDIASTFALNHAAPDSQVYFGIARRF